MKIKLYLHYYCFGWQRSVVVSTLASINVVNWLWAQFGWPSAGRLTVSVCNKSPRLTHPSIPPGYINQVPACLAGVKVGWGVFTCVECQVTLCDPIWQVTHHSCVIGSFNSYTVSLPFMCRMQPGLATVSDLRLAFLTWEVSTALLPLLDS